METNETTQQTGELKNNKHQFHKNNGHNSRSSKILSWMKSPRSDVALFVILLVLINLVSVRAFKRLDLTGPKSYSLSTASKEVVKTIEEPLSVKVFFSSNLPAPYNSVDQYVRDILVEYKNAANKNFSYEYFDMNKPANQEIATGYGIQQVQVREYKNNEANVKNAYMGMVFVYADQIEKLDDIESSSGLEYKITTTINKIVSAANIMTGLTGNVKLTLYLSTPVTQLNINGINQVEDKVKKVYDAFNKKNSGRIDFQVVNPAQNELNTIVQKYGIGVINWKNADGTMNSGALGLVLEYNDAFRVIPISIQNLGIFYDVTGSFDSLEDNLSKSMSSLLSHTNKVGYLVGNGEADPDDENSGFAFFSNNVSDQYEITKLDLVTDDIPSDMQCVIINGPKTTFNENALYKIDQFIMRGGNVMFLLDPYDIQQPQYQGQQATYTPINTGLEKLLSKYGIECGKNYVMDEECYSVFLQNQTGKTKFFYTPLLLSKWQDSKSPITKNLNKIMFADSSSVDVSKAQGDSSKKVTVLARTSPKSWTISDNIELNPFFISAPTDKSSEKAQTIAAMVEGKFTSAFDKKPEDASSTDKNAAAGKDAAMEVTAVSHVSTATQSGKIFVAGTSSIINIPSAEVVRYFYEQDQDLQGYVNSTALYIRNVVDYMNNNADLCTMRTKGLSLNTLDIDNDKDAGEVNFWKYFNQFGLAVLVAIAGLLVLLARKNHRETIRLRYDPTDSRQIVDSKKSKKEESK